jgi:hypothetical protein
MKLVIIAAALLLGGTAAAQTAEDPSAMAPTGAIAPGCTGPKTVAADNRYPEVDARGIQVRSHNGVAPDCYNEHPRQVPAETQPFSPTPGVGQSGPVPDCDATHTDGCKQTYERRRRPRY